MTNTVFQVNRPAVSAESFDDEVVIIHFESGNYYSLDAFGTRAWAALEAGSTTEQIVEHVLAGFQSEQAIIAEKIDILMDRLLQEDLIRSHSGPAGKINTQPVEQKEPLPETAGTLLKFDDMQELLLLDPIHDVDEAGWPHTTEDPVD